MKIGSLDIGDGFAPFIIAEMSGNHNSSLDRALQIVKAAADAGVQAIKLQTYTADTLTLDLDENEFHISNPDIIWKGKSLYQLYQQAYTPWEWHEPIMEFAKELGLICFSTPFDETAVDFLEELNVPAYKIASFENNHLPLIRRVASTGKPLIISTGMASLATLDEAVTTARNNGCSELILLKCTSSYPASPEHSNLLTVPHMRELFDCEIGVSDHTLGIGVAIASVALGASVIEKHFTLSRAEGGVDSAFSLEQTEMAALVGEVTDAWRSLGKVHYGISNSEQKSIQFKRSVYVSKDMEKGEILTTKNIKIIRPGSGLQPKYFEVVLGKKINRKVHKGTPLDWNLIG